MQERVEIEPRAAQQRSSALSVNSGDDSSGMMIETLEISFSKSRGHSVRIREVHRQACEHVSSFQAEHLRVTLDTGEQIPVFFKDMNPSHQIETARKVRAGDLDPSYRELRVYQQILSQADLGTPQLYAVRWEAERGLYWMFLEDVGTSRLRDSRNYQRWVPAARWAARFHSATLHLPPEQTHFLPVYDPAHYRHCAERVRDILPGLSPRDRALVTRAFKHFTSRIEWFFSLPKTVIHGQFFGKNIMLRAHRDDHVFAVIDWETAALGPRGFDLVSISSGRWTASQRKAMWRAYFDEYQAQTRHSVNWNDFCHEVREIEIYQALEWIGWWRNRSVSHNFGRWIKELKRIMDDGPQSS